MTRTNETEIVTEIGLVTYQAFIAADNARVNRDQPVDRCPGEACEGLGLKPIRETRCYWCKSIHLGTVFADLMID